MANTSVQPQGLSTPVCPTCANAAQASSASADSLAITRYLSLMTRICDHMAELAIAVNGYIALERFVSPIHADETRASLAPSRAELNGLLHALNALVQQHLDALAFATAVLQAEMSNGEVQAR